jgi:hypothetical protein
LGVEGENIESRKRYAAAKTTPSASIATSEEDATAISGRNLERIIVDRTKPREKAGRVTREKLKDKKRSDARY